MNQEWLKFLEKKLDQVLFILKGFTNISNLHDLQTLPCAQCETEIKYYKNFDGSINRICKCIEIINPISATFSTPQQKGEQNASK